MNFPTNTIRTIRSRSIRCAGHVASVGEKGDAYRVQVGELERKRPHPDVGGRIIMILIIR